MSTAPNLGQHAGSEARNRTFTRITLQGASRQVDLAVPDDMPMPELVRIGVQELGGNPRGRWQVVHPTLGAIAEPATLGSAGVRDGEMLTLVPDEMVAADRAVDDVADSVRLEVARRGLWDQVLAREVGDWLLAGWVLLSAWYTTRVPSGPAELVAGLCGLALLLLVMAGRRITRMKRTSEGLAVGAVLTGGLLAWRAAPLFGLSGRLAGATLLLCLLVTTVASILLSPALRPRLRPLAVGLLVALEVVGLAALVALAWDGPRLATVATIGLLALLGATNEFVVAFSGLSRLDQDAVVGEHVTQRNVFDRLDDARRDLAAQLLVLSVSMALLCVTLTTSNQRAAVVFGLVMLVLLLLRARSYATPVHVLVVAVPALAGLAWTLLAWMAHQPQARAIAVLLAVAGLLTTFSFVAAPAVLASRLRLQLDRVERWMLLVVVPLAAWVFDLYATVYARFR